MNMNDMNGMDGMNDDGTNVVPHKAAMIDWIGFGIVIDDIALPDGTTTLGILGGGGPQTAWGMAAALGAGETVGLVAEVGRDFDFTALDRLQAARINLEGVRTSTSTTPRAWQYMDADGGRRHEWQSPPTKSITFGTSIHDLLPPSYHQARGLHWGLHPESPAFADAQVLMRAGKRVSLETFKPPEKPLDDEALGQLMGACSVFSPGWTEAIGITGSADEGVILRCFSEAGGHMLALRRGAAGADVWDLRARRGVRVPAVPTQIVDTVGAGNAFCGALLVMLDAGLESAACHAVAAASYLVEQYGLPPSLPHPDSYQRRVAFAENALIPLQFPLIGEA